MYEKSPILGIKMSAKYGTFLFVTRLSNHGTNIYGFFVQGTTENAAKTPTEIPQKHRLKYHKSAD